MYTQSHYNNNVDEKINSDSKYGHHIQWCSGKFSLVGTLTWHYGHIPYRYQGGGGVVP